MISDGRKGEKMAGRIVLFPHLLQRETRGEEERVDTNGEKEGSREVDREFL